MSACSSGTRPATIGQRAPRPLTVFAAASLTGAFTELGKTYERARPGGKVTFNFAGSATLVEQLKQGSPADVFASADDASMKRASDSGSIAGSPKTFVRNKLQIVVPARNPARVSTVADLAKPEIKVALCAPEVPAGRYAAEVFQKAGITVSPVTTEDNVKAVVTKAQLGEVDAGIVYVTDVKAGGDKVAGVVIPDDLNLIATYRIGVTTDGSKNPSAESFIDYVLSAEGQSVLATFGFAGPA